MSDQVLPILYSFRRCPYAMRARLAIAYSGVKVELREIVLRDKPTEMLAISPKGTVPVLLLPDGQLIDESIDIMRWALSQNDPDNWCSADIETINGLINDNDHHFKPWLDRYKYADRYPQQSAEFYRQQCEDEFIKLEPLLARHGGYLVTDRITLADMARLPFIRQCAHVDLTWFESTPYPHLQRWLSDFKASGLFADIMRKYPLWALGDPITLFP